MRYLFASLALVLWTGVCALAQDADPPKTDPPPTDPPAQTQPADPPRPIFRLGGAPPKDDGRWKPPPPADPVKKPDATQPATRPAVVQPTPDTPVDAPKPDDSKPDPAKPATNPAKPDPITGTNPPATQTASRPDDKSPATRPEIKGPFRLGHNDVDLPKPGPETAPASKPSPKSPEKVAKTDPADPDKELSTKEPPFTLPDFPPGLFSDGNFYRLPDHRGKVIVLFFFDSSDERVIATIPQRNALVKRFHDKPVVFFGIENDTIQNVRSSARALNLQMPVFADTLGVMMARYNVRINGSTTWNVCIINPAGKASHEEMTEASIEKALANARWRYRDKFTVDPRLNSAVDALEALDFERGMRLVQLYASHSDKRVADSAKELLAILRKEADLVKVEAEKCGPTESVQAYDYYNRIMLTCPGSDIAKSIADPYKKLSNHREVKPEVTARWMYKVLCGAISRDEGIEKWDVAGYCEEIIRVAPGTPTADALVKYLGDLGKVRERGIYGPRQYRRAQVGSR